MNWISRWFPAWKRAPDSFWHGPAAPKLFNCRCVILPQVLKPPGEQP